MATPATISGRAVVVTGGSRGIGKALVERFLARGNKVIATTRSRAAAAALADLAARDANLTVTELDTSVPASISAWAQHVKTLTSHVDVLVNNAGVYGRRVPLEVVEPADFELAFNTNALGPFLVTQQLLKQGLLGGAAPPPPAPPKTLIVNVTSVLASHGDAVVSGAAGGGYAYRASKAALNIISKALALDLGPRGVAVTSVHPGYVRTDMTGGEGWVSVDESADGVLRLLEDGRELHGKWYAFDGSEVPW